MKFTQKQLVDFALKAGVPVVEVVADDAASDYNEDTALKDVHKAVTPIIRPSIEAELTTALEPTLTGKITGQMYSLLAKESGLTRAELEKMKIGDAAQHAFTHIQTKLGGDTAALQKEITEMARKHTEAIEKLTKDKDSEISVANQRYTDIGMKDYLNTNIVSKAPLLDTADKNYYTEQLLNVLKTKYHLTYDEAKKAVNTFKKDNPAMPALNESGTAVIDIAKEFEAIAKPAGVWKTDQRQVNPADQMKTQKLDEYGKPALQAEGPRGRRANRPTPEQVAAKMKEIEAQ